MNQVKKMPPQDRRFSASMHASDDRRTSQRSPTVQERLELSIEIMRLREFEKKHPYR